MNKFSFETFQIYGPPTPTWCFQKDGSFKYVDDGPAISYSWMTPGRRGLLSEIQIVNYILHSSKPNGVSSNSTREEVPSIFGSEGVASKLTTAATTGHEACLISNAWKTNSLSLAHSLSYIVEIPKTDGVTKSRIQLQNLTLSSSFSTVEVDWQNLKVENVTGTQIPVNTGYSRVQKISDNGVNGGDVYIVFVTYPANSFTGFDAAHTLRVLLYPNHTDTTQRSLIVHHRQLTNRLLGGYGSPVITQGAAVTKAQTLLGFSREYFDQKEEWTLYAETEDHGYQNFVTDTISGVAGLQTSLAGYTQRMFLMQRSANSLSAAFVDDGTKLQKGTVYPRGTFSKLAMTVGLGKKSKVSFNGEVQEQNEMVRPYLSTMMTLGWSLTNTRAFNGLIFNVRILEKYIEDDTKFSEMTKVV